MKKIILTLSIALISLMSFTTADEASKIFDYLENEHDAFSMSISKSMTDFFDLDVDFNGKEKWVKGDFKKGKMLIVNHHVSKDKISGMFEKAGFEKVSFEEDDEEDNVALMIKRKGKNVAEAHFLVEEEDSLILLSIYGDMKVSDK